MIKNYLLIAWRNLLKHKIFSLINILGLAIGIAACLLIFLYVQHEFTFDQYNTKADRIARITTTMHAPESDLVLATSPTPLAATLKREFPEVENAVCLDQTATIVKLNNEFTREEEFYKTDQPIFAVFDFEFLEGSAAEALQQPNTVVLTASTAKKYFGNTPSLGITITCDGTPVLITGVVKDRPANSDLPIKGLLSTDFSKETKWVENFDLYTYVLFRRPTNLAAFERKVTSLTSKYLRPELDAMGAKEYRVDFKTEALADVHFSQGKLGDTPKGNKQSNYIFSVLAIFILLIALLNYINLSTAKSMERAKEVGIRKVSGASPFQLVRQFLFESFFLITIAWLLGMALVRLTLPFFNQLLDTSIVVNWTAILLFTAAVFFITVLLAGVYPSFVLSSFQPIKVLKSGWRYSGKGVGLRKIVTITQFAIAAALIMGTIVVYYQLRFIDQKDLGFNKDQLMNIYLPRDSAYQSAVAAFRNALEQRPEIQDLTVGSGMVDGGMSVGTTITKTAGKKREMMCNYYAIDPHFLSVFQIQLAAGRNLSDSFGTDKQEAFLVNEAFVQSMGWKTAIGQEMEGWDHKGKVIGVVKNFYYRSLHNMVEPLVMVYNKFPVNTISVRIKQGSLPVVKQLFQQYFQDRPIDYAFFDEMVNKQYSKDKVTRALFTDFTILAIFVSCLGLYGLVALVAAQRTKEIGTRKVLGASLGQLLALLTKDFMKLLLWALVIALPVAGFVMYKWLSSYAYHTPLYWWMFVLPAVLLLIIALAVISREVIKTALVNPVKSLRAE
jgi:putative ABC transport system permease protein